MAPQPGNAGGCSRLIAGSPRNRGPIPAADGLAPRLSVVVPSWPARAARLGTYATASGDCESGARGRERGVSGQNAPTLCPCKAGREGPGGADAARPERASARTLPRRRPLAGQRSGVVADVESGPARLGRWLPAMARGSPASRGRGGGGRAGRRSSGHAFPPVPGGRGSGGGWRGGVVAAMWFEAGRARPVGR